jgi:hypothetical protein
MLNLPDSRVRRIRTDVPAEAIEANPLQGVEIDAFETACVYHVVRRIRARAVEGSDTAMATEVMESAPHAELIGRNVLLSSDETESIWRYHVVEVTLPTADRAIAFAYPSKLGSNFELHPATMARTSIGFHSAFRHHVSLPAVNAKLSRRC